MIEACQHPSDSKTEEVYTGEGLDTMPFQNLEKKLQDIVKQAGIEDTVLLMAVDKNRYPVDTDEPSYLTKMAIDIKNQLHLDGVISPEDSHRNSVAPKTINTNLPIKSCEDQKKAVFKGDKTTQAEQPLEKAENELNNTETSPSTSRFQQPENEREFDDGDSLFEDLSDVET